MSEKLSGYDQLARYYLAPFLIVILVAGTGFSLGYSIQKRSVSADETSEAATTTSTTADNKSFISDIAQSLQTGDTVQTNESAANSEATTSQSTVPNGLININDASSSQLEALPGIGPTKAKAIIDYRSTNGPFIKVDDLLKVKGIGPKTLEGMKAQITL